MGKYQLTNRAEAEIDLIFEHSILNFGLRTAQDYLIGMHECFDMLADNPSWGNDYGFIEPGLQRYEYRSHSVYYRERGDLYFPQPMMIRLLGDPDRADSSAGLFDDLIFLDRPLFFEMPILGDIVPSTKLPDHYRFIHFPVEIF